MTKAPYLFCLILWTLKCEGKQRCGQPSMTEYGYMLEASYYDVGQVEGVDKCFFRCLRDPRCQSFNMRLSTMVCMLFLTSHFFVNRIRASDDLVYFANTAHPCYTIRCKNGSSCILPGTCDCNGTKHTGEFCGWYPVHPSPLVLKRPALQALKIHT